MSENYYSTLTPKANNMTEHKSSNIRDVFRSEYKYEIEYEYDFSNLVPRVYISLWAGSQNNVRVNSDGRKNKRLSPLSRTLFCEPACKLGYINTSNTNLIPRASFSTGQQQGGGVLWEGDWFEIRKSYS